MKKTFALLLVFLMLLSLGGCSSETNEGPEPGTALNTFYQAIMDVQPKDADALILFQESNPDLIASFYPGLDSIELSQQAFYMPPIVTHPCEIVLVEVKNSDDVQAVVEIFQARIDKGADNKSYPESAVGWQMRARVQKSGNFVCMIVLPEGYIIPENVFEEHLAEGVDSSGVSNEKSVSADNTVSDVVENHVAVDTELKEEIQTITPIPDTTMENLTDAILSVSLEKGDAYVDDSGIMQMDLHIYTYDKYDMVDIANLKVGDIIVRHSGKVEVISKEQNEAGTVYINGGLEMGGFDLVTDDCGIFYERGFNDSKNWYEVGEATIRVSVDFKGIDNADLERGEFILYPGSFLIDEVTNYNFTPYNTTIRVEEGQIVEMNRVYIP